LRLHFHNELKVWHMKKSYPVTSDNLITRRKFGKTADLARAAGAQSSETRWVAGVRFRF
jgi:hypothetical protein